MREGRTLTPNEHEEVQQLHNTLHKQITHYLCKLETYGKVDELGKGPFDPDGDTGYSIVVFSRPTKKYVEKNPQYFNGIGDDHRLAIGASTMVVYPPDVPPTSTPAQLIREGAHAVCASALLGMLTEGPEIGVTMQLALEAIIDFNKSH